MAIETNIYDKQFFKNTIKLELDSALAVVKIILEHYQPSSVIDLGCGAGIYLQAFAKQGVKDLLGIDGAPAAKDEFIFDPKKILIFDLSKKLKLPKKYDLCLCLEVAEHLPASQADKLVDNIIGAADKIIFTAAVPGQGPRSIGHINEQPNSYWIKKFQKKNFRYRRKLSNQLRQAMKKQEVVWWISNNLMIFEKKK